MTKIHNWKQLPRRTVCLSLWLERTQFVMARKSGCRTQCKWSLPQPAEGRARWMLTFGLALLQSRTAVSWLIAPTFLAVLPAANKPFWKHPHRNNYKCFSVFSEPVKFAVKIVRVLWILLNVFTFFFQRHFSFLLDQRKQSFWDTSKILNKIFWLQSIFF